MILLLLAAAGCREDMSRQPKVAPLDASSFFADGRASRPAVEGTVPQGTPVLDRHLEDGRDAAGALVAELPFPATREVLRRGRERYDVFCAPCHGRTGDGDGMIVQRGFPRPQSFHQDRLRAAPVGSLYDAVKNGFGAMPDHRAEIPVRDRWAIVAYVRALELSQNARLADVPEDARRALEEAKR